MLVGTLPSTLEHRAKVPPFCRACLISLCVHGAALALAAHLGGLSPWPDGGVPQRLEVRIASRPTATIASEQTNDSTAMDEGARANGDASTGAIVTTPPEPLGEIPLLVEGAPGVARLNLELDANGKVVAVRVESSTLEPSAEQEMVERIRAVRFHPAMENGKPVAGRLSLEARVESAGR